MGKADSLMALVGTVYSSDLTTSKEPCVLSQVAQAMLLLSPVALCASSWHSSHEQRLNIHPLC